MNQDLMVFIYENKNCAFPLSSSLAIFIMLVCIWYLDNSSIYMEETKTKFIFLF